MTKTFGKRNLIRWAAVGCAAVSAAALLTAHTSVARAADDNGGMGKIQQEARPTKTVYTEWAKAVQKLHQTLGDGQALADEGKRAALAEKLVPAARKQVELSDELVAAAKDDSSLNKPTVSMLTQQAATAKQDGLAYLYVCGDQPTITKVDAMATSETTNDEIAGKSVKLLSQWYVTGPDEAKEAKVADDLTALDKEHLSSAPLAMLTIKVAQSAKSDDVKKRLMSLVADDMKTPISKQVKAQMAADAKLASLEGKPMEVVGKTVGGKDFSSAQYKGKVVLVDFWATWCGPCIAGLPEVQKTYEKYHGQGLEIVGVSNDYSAEKLTSFTKEKDMPWVQLLDADAASEQKWNPLTQGYGINGIPTMFLIDKKGICRTVKARENMKDMIPKLLAE